MIHWYTLEPELLWCNLLAQASWKRLRYEMLAFHWSSHPSAMAHKAFWRSRPCVQIRDNGRSSLACCLCQSEQVQPALFLIFSITYSWASADILAPVILTAFIAISFGGDHVPHAVDLCPSSSGLRGFTGNGQSWSIEIETMPFHKNPRQLHLPQVIHRQQLHGHGSLSLFFRVCFFWVSGGIMSPVIIPARWRTQRDRRSCCRSPWNLVSWSHATVRPGYHFVILESSVRKYHDEIMDWLRQHYEKTVQKNKHLHKDIARSAKKLNETAEARSYVCMCSVLAVSMKPSGRKRASPKSSWFKAVLGELCHLWMLIHIVESTSSSRAVAWQLILILLASMSLDVVCWTCEWVDMLGFFFKWGDHVSVCVSWVVLHLQRNSFLVHIDWCRLVRFFVLWFETCHGWKTQVGPGWCGDCERFLVLQGLPGSLSTPPTSVLGGWKFLEAVLEDDRWYMNVDCRLSIYIYIYIYRQTCIQYAHYLQNFHAYQIF